MYKDLKFLYRLKGFIELMMLCIIFNIYSFRCSIFSLESYEIYIWYKEFLFNYIIFGIREFWTVVVLIR